MIFGKPRVYAIWHFGDVIAVLPRTRLPLQRPDRRSFLWSLASLGFPEQSCDGELVELDDSSPYLKLRQVFRLRYRVHFHAVPQVGPNGPTEDENPIGSGSRFLELRNASHLHWDQENGSL